MSKTLPPKRSLIFAIGLICITGIILGRLIKIQLIDHHYYEKKANKQLTRIISKTPNRGHIFTQNQRPLAIMQESYSLFAIPKQVSATPNEIKELSNILKISSQNIITKLQRKSHFVWIKRHNDKKTYEKIKAMKLKGLSIIKENRRYYPEQNLASHVLGICGIDNQGLSGIEYIANKTLSGNPGKIILERDPKGHALTTGQKQIKATNHGENITLTIDEYTQHISEKFLKQGIDTFQAKRGYAVILDSQSAAILAMASLPNFNPNQWQTSSENVFINPCINHVFEPGSVLKCITIAMALEEKLVSKNDILFVPRELPVFSHRIRESHPAKADEPYEKSITDILKYSSNVGTALIAQKGDKDLLYGYLKKFGFGSKSHCGLPGESAGLLRAPKNWSGVDLETHAFGQGLAVNALQLTAAMNVFANKGHYKKPFIIKEISNHNQTSRIQNMGYENKKLLSEETISAINPMLKAVVESGTAWPVKLKNYYIAGKTGTAQKAKENGRGYQTGNYIASFVGFFPYNNPKITMAIVLDSPQKNYYGGHSAGKIFKNIAEALALHYHYPPDY